MPARGLLSRVETTGEGGGLRLLVQIGEILQKRGFPDGLVVQEVVDPGPRFSIVARETSLMFARVSSRARLGRQPVFRSSGIGHVVGVESMSIARSLKVFRKSLVEPEREITHFRVEQGVGGLMAKVLIKTIVLIGVNHAAPALPEKRCGRGR